MDHIFFNAHHSPVGAFASFTLGYLGNRGGLGLELGRAPNQNIYIGVETAQKDLYQALPFYAGSTDDSARYDVEATEKTLDGKAKVVPFNKEDIRREFNLGTDTWRAGDLSFTVYTPAAAVPDPASASAEDLKRALLPAVFAELTVDNSKGKTARTAFFGYTGSDPYTSMRRLDDVTGSRPPTDGREHLVRGTPAGIANGRVTAIASADNFDQSVVSGLGFAIENILKPLNTNNLSFALGGCGAIKGVVLAGERKTFRFVLCFYRGGLATGGLDTTYFYTRFFKNIEEVAAYGVQHFEAYKQAALEANRALDTAFALNAHQKFQLAHAIRSYYGSTEFLDCGGQPYWVVNEGEYRMMNTFDLTVDMLFYEMKLNPWTVRNELDIFVERYSYRDQVHFPGEEKEYPGGLSFTHDQGMANNFTRPGYSSYEQFGLDGCFSHMTHEQLVNWVCCAGVYVAQTNDQAWLDRRAKTVADCLESMLNRDHPDPAQRNGIMALDSNRTLNGAEITTYDSLDASLGQARNNLYMAVKCWAAYLLLDKLLRRVGKTSEADTAALQARRCAKTLCENVKADGYIPAVFEAGNDSKIIPAIEGLIFPLKGGAAEALAEDGPFGDLIRVLKTHIETVLKPGVCLFEDGGWKLSSTSENSWLSKIYLCQYVYRKILGFPWDADGAKADRAHVSWLLHAEECYHAWCDQMVKGVARGSKYYPRGVTAILWLEE